MTDEPERLLEEARPHRPRRLTRRERWVELLGAAALLATAGAMAATVGSSRAPSAGLIVLYAALYAAACRVRLYVGAGSALPTQLVFVPMLFALPLGAVPLVVAAGLAASALVDVARGRAHPERVITAIGDAWYAVAPAAVLALAGSPPADAAHWPVFVLAFAAQSALDVAASTAREWAGRAIRPGLQLRVMGSVYAVDALLAPVGLLIASEVGDHPLAPLVAVPLLALLGIFSRDRRRRIDQAVARLDELERERAKLQGAIRHVGQAFASNLDRGALLALVVETAMDVLDATGGRAFAGDEIVERGAAGPGDYAITRPLREAGRVTVARGGPFSAREEELLGYLASQCAVSLENARLHAEVMRQATVDELTGLSNHRRMQQALDEELARSRRFPTPMSLLILDIDNFKKVNDTYGHLQGDAVLRAVAGAVRTHTRVVDEAARYGGEELAVLFRGTELDGAHAAAETIRRAIEDLRIPLDGEGSIRVTASFGVAQLARGETDKNELIAAADAALYTAKRSGKNRVVTSAARTPAA